MDKVAAVVVTYNRKNDLVNCLAAILGQKRTPDRLYIIDNHSTDGTPDLLVEHGYVKAVPAVSQQDQRFDTECKGLAVSYIRKAVNDGGAGGFFKGMETAYNDGHDWVWMMDDDGIPEEHQLEILLSTSENNDLLFTNALLIDRDDNDRLAFGLKGYDLIIDIKETGLIYDFINPFNGTLINRSLISDIGFVKKEMFIWGDEKEFMLRAKKSGYRFATVLDAKHYHPKIKGSTVQVFPFLKGIKLVLKPDHLSRFYYRNLGYIEKTYSKRKVRWVTRFNYLTYFLMRFKFGEAIKFLKFYDRGVRNNYS